MNKNKFRIVSENGNFIPQKKFLFWWVRVPYVWTCDSYGKLEIYVEYKRYKYVKEYRREDAMNSIKNYYGFKYPKTYVTKCGVPVRYLDLNGLYVCTHPDSFTYEGEDSNFSRSTYKAKIWSEKWDEFTEKLNEKYTKKAVEYVSEKDINKG